MEPIAIISDIHANLAAFKAALDDVRSLGIHTVYCLGDVIGYGPQPVECLDLARGLTLNLLGNHEEAVLYGAVGFNARARQAIQWTRERLLDESEALNLRQARWNFLGDLATRHDEEEVSWVHGSPREPTREYIFHSDVNDHEKMQDLFTHIRSICFAGHTHVPGLWTEDFRYLHPTQLPDGNHPVNGKRLICNVGSVGQPRDGDPRGCYVVFDGSSIRFRRVEYDVDRTVEAILKIRELPPYLGLRLREGR